MTAIGNTEDDINYSLNGEVDENNVTIGGQVPGNSGRAIGNVFVSLTAPDGTTRNARTNLFGYYRFNDV